MLTTHKGQGITDKGAHKEDNADTDENTEERELMTR